MKYSLKLRDEAEKELIEAGKYYEEIRDGLGERFISHVEHYFRRIVQNPKLYPQKKKYREAYVIKFPFIIIYKIEEDKVIIMSVFHTSQDLERKP